MYWKPIYNLLEGLDLTLLVVNAQHIKAMPGRKTEVKDAQWIAVLLRHGLPRGSYFPDRPHSSLGYQTPEEFASTFGKPVELPDPGGVTVPILSL